MYQKTEPTTIIIYTVVPHKFCRKMWLRSLYISNTTFVDWRKSDCSTRNVLPVNFYLAEMTSNNGRLKHFDAIRNFIRDSSEYEGHPLPVRLQSSDDLVCNARDGTE